jgi:type I restriction enzyme S subunit
MNGDELPEGWAEAAIRSVVVSLDQGWSPKCENEASGSPDKWGVIKTTAVQPIMFDESENKLLPLDLDPRPSLELKEGDLLITRAGPRARAGVCCLVRKPRPRLMICDKVYRFRVNPNCALGSWLVYFLNEPKTVEEIDTLKTGISDSGVNLTQDKFLGLQLPVAPLSEQHRIVEKVEALLAEVNASREKLAKVPGILKRFRQAVLAAACSGRLTEGWRDQVRPGPLRRKGIDLDGLPELPEFPDAWGLAPLEAVAERFQYGTSDKADADEHTGVPVLRMSNIQDGAIDLSVLKYIKRSPLLHPFMISRGDVLFNRTNSPELVGKTAVVDSDGEMVFASYLVRAQVKPTEVRPLFVSWWLNSLWGREWARRVRTDGVSQSNINATKLAAMPIPLPTLAEQDEAIRRGASLLCLADAIEARVKAATARAEKIPQAILAKAFKGELVPTEAEVARAEGRAYETAAEMLERVRAASPADKGSKKGRTTRRART